MKMILEILKFILFFAINVFIFTVTLPSLFIAFMYNVRAIIRIWEYICKFFKNLFKK